MAGRAAHPLGAGIEATEHPGRTQTGRGTLFLCRRLTRMAADRVWGIDLGTTNSCIAYVDDTERAVVVPNQEAQNTTPSVVFFEEPTSIAVGEAAKNAAMLHPRLVAQFIKREMDDPDFTFEAHGTSYRPEEVSALVLRKLALDAEASTGEPVKRVVITVPAYFGNTARARTRQAGELVGLDVIDIVDEPIAAAISYGMKVTAPETVLVYDFGGGTFDATVVRCAPGGIRVLSKDGDPRLGGADLDAILVTHFIDEFQRQCPDGGDPSLDESTMQDLWRRAESCKRALSVREKDTQPVSHSGFTARVTVTREQFVALIDAIIERTLSITAAALDAARAQHGVEHIDRLLLVGGSSRIPAVKTKLARRFGLDPVLFDPDLSVCKGAALFGIVNAAKEQLAAGASAAAVAEELGLPTERIEAYGALAIASVNAKAVGVIAVHPETRQRQVAHLIHANTQLPFEVTQRFYTIDPGPSILKVQVMEQAGETESPVVENNVEITQGDIHLPAGLQARAPVDVTFQLAEDGTLTVLAKEVTSGRDLSLVVKVKGLMNAQEQAASRETLLQMAVA